MHGMQQTTLRRAAQHALHHSAQLPRPTHRRAFGTSASASSRCTHGRRGRSLIAACCAAADAKRAAPRQAKDVIQEFYSAYNCGDVNAVMGLMADDVSYHDLALYNEPFRGKEAVRAYFERVTSTVPGDLKFTPEALTDGGTRAVGVRWHVEIRSNEGRDVEFPFSRGVSFYEINEEGLITSARDLVETATKPGGAALFALRGLAPIVRKLGTRANPGNLPNLPPSCILMWLFYAGYLWHILLSADAPGAAAWQQSAESIKGVLNESINFFYVNIGLGTLGISPLPVVAENPVSEALFNFVNAWSLMLGPLMFADTKADRVPNKMPLWIGTMFLTNIFFIAFLALRETIPAAVNSSDSSPGSDQSRLPAPAPLAGWVAGVVGAVSIWWALFARPEFGGIVQRLQYAASSLTGDRIFYAFVVDAVLYAVWQAALMPPSAGRLRFMPFWGAAQWLTKSKQ